MKESARFYLSICMLSRLKCRQAQDKLFSVRNIVPRTLSMNLNNVFTKVQTPTRFTVQPLTNLEEPS
jgi:hypothetical protein